MKYSVSKLAKEYSQHFLDKELELTTPTMPEFDFETYNEYEYLNLINALNQEFDSFNDLNLTEQFLISNSFDDSF